MMKILFVTPYYYPEVQFGGPPRRIHTMSRHLIARGHAVRVLTFHSNRPQSTGNIEQDGVQTTYLPWLGSGLRQIPSSKRAANDAVNRADIIHCYGLYNLLVPMASFLAAKKDKPFLLEPMGMYVPRVKNVLAKRFYNATLTRWMTNQASALVATSRIEQKELSELAINTPIVIRRNGIDISDWESLPSRTTARGRWNIEERDKLVVYIGRISAKKCLLQLVSAFIEADVPSSRLIIAGPVSEVSYRRELLRVIQSSNRAASIRLEGAVYDDELKGLLAAADLFVLPSLNENFGNAAGEAVAAGVPVLLTDTCGIARLIHGRAGMSVPLGLEALTKGIRSMLDSEICHQMTARRAEVKRELSWDGPIQQTEELYERIIRNSKRR